MMSLKKIKTVAVMVMVMGSGLMLSCTPQNLPLSSSTPAGPLHLTDLGIKEVPVPGGLLIFAPTAYTDNVTLTGGAITMGKGRNSYAQVFSLPLPPMPALPSLVNMPAGNYTATAPEIPIVSEAITGDRGIGGPLGNFTTDYYLRFKGFKAVDSSLDYISSVISFVGPTTAYDISSYTKLRFYARGNGINLSISLAGGRFNKDPCPGGRPVCPYTDYNFYTYIIGPTLKNSWVFYELDLRENFAQQYATDTHPANIEDVLKATWGIQIGSEGSGNFEIDLDYIHLL